MSSFLDLRLSVVSGVVDRLRYDATIRKLELIGEAATQVPEAVRRECADIPWHMIIATRKRMIHGYLGIDIDTLWSLVNQDVPVHLPKLRALRYALQTPNDAGSPNNHE
jgi:uncharacterized protein with HEPN domain